MQKVYQWHDIILFIYSDFYEPPEFLTWYSHIGLSHVWSDAVFTVLSNRVNSLIDWLSHYPVWKISFGMI